jgi:hypothetical protein
MSSSKAVIIWLDRPEIFGGTWQQCMLLNVGLGRPKGLGGALQQVLRIHDKFFCILLSEGTFTSFSKINSQKEVTIH